jgi:hypothetical protein
LWPARRECYRDVVLRSTLGGLAIVVLALSAAPAWGHGPRSAESRLDRPPAVLTPSGPTRSAEIASSTVLREPVLAGLPQASTASGAAGAIGVVIAALGLVGLGRSWRRDRRAGVAVATAGLLLGFVAETTPHLVHHSLDADQGASCEVLQVAERSQGAVGASDAAPASTLADLDERPRSVPEPMTSALPPCERAPPA